MAASNEKKGDIEMKARHSAYRAKRRNDHESRLLALQLQQLHKQTVSSLEEHWKNTMEVVNIFKGCHRTSGVSPLGIDPKDSDVEGGCGEAPRAMKPWAYCSRFSIESWYKRDENSFKRPQTVDAARRAANRDKTRPNTAPDINSYNLDDHSSAKTKIQMMEWCDEARRRRVLQIQAKAATMTRSKFLDLENTGPVYNKNLAATLGRSSSKFGEADNSQVARPRTEVNWEAVASRLGREKSFQEARDGAWDLNCVRNQMKHLRAASRSTDGRPARSRAPANKPKDKKTEQTSADGEKAGKVEGIEEKPSAGYQRNITQNQPGHKSLRQRKAHSRTRKPARSNERKTSDGEAEEREHCLDMMSRLTRQPITHSARIKASKFYIPPEERYKMEQRFLMKRYYFLHRQMNNNHDEQASILARAQTALIIKPTFSRSARLRLLDALIEENKEQRKIERRFGNDELMRAKVEAFLEKVTAFVQHCTPEEETGQDVQKASQTG